LALLSFGKQTKQKLQQLKQDSVENIKATSYTSVLENQDIATITEVHKIAKEIK
jgi:hypothetical protein